MNGGKLAKGFNNNYLYVSFELLRHNKEAGR